MSSNKKPPRFTSCLGKLVLWLWLIIIGAVGGVWLGINIERMYPGRVVPDMPFFGKISTAIPFAKPQVRTGDGLIIAIAKSIRNTQNQEMEIYFSVTNDGNTPVEISHNAFYLMDNRQRRYEESLFNQNISGVEYMISFLDPLNPGLSRNYRIVFPVPNNVKSFELYYNGTKIGRVQ